MKWTGTTGQGCYKTDVKKRGLLSFISPFTITFLLLTFLPGPVIPGSVTQAFAQLYINEFMADNDSAYEDPNHTNNFDDWIEIYNSGDAAVSMAGMYLTDDLADPTKWQVPNGVTIPKKGYLIFWADNEVEQGSTHTSFALSAGGEEIGLFKKVNNTTLTLVDSVTFVTQLLDVSYGRFPNGTGTWGFMAYTPGTANIVHNAPPAITGTAHDPVSPGAADPVWVTCTVTDDSAGEIVVMLTYNGGSGPVNVRMQDDGENHDGESDDDIFGAPIPAFPQDTTVHYYITATDESDVEATDPATAPAATYYYIVGYVPPVLFINEFMADNESTIKDPNSFEDWIEIYNPGNSTVNMAGMYLTDNLANPTQWRVPTGVTIPAKDYLIFWADNDVEEGAYHTSFALSAGGEEIGLFGADGVTLVDSVTFGAQLTDVSYGRFPDGSGTWGFMTPATPDNENNQHNPPPAIAGTAHAPVSPAAVDPVWVTCMVTDNSAGVVVKLTYNAGSGMKDVQMLDNGANHDGESGDGIFGARIPAFSNGIIVDYYITATDVSNAVTTDPATAPAATYYYIVGYVQPPLFINEFMADNKGTIPDPQDPNSFPDWIEIYNAGDSIVSMVGMYLSDDLADPAKWQIPSGVTIPAGGHLIFWADNDEEQGVYHAGFRLNKDGGEVGLFDTDAKRHMPIDTMTFGKQPADYSWGRIYDGEGPLVLSRNPTPGYTNAFPLGTHPMIWTFSQTIASYALIKEMGGYVSAIERYNATSGKRESAYHFWGRPSGRKFSIEPGEGYIISFITPCLFPFE